MPARSRKLPFRGKVLAGLLVIVGLPLALLLWPYQGYTGQVVVIIEHGMKRRVIAERLTAEGVLYSRWPFLVYAYAQPHRTLKAGEYVFDRPLSIARVFAKLTRGEIHLYPLTIPEGYTRWHIADEVARLRLASRQSFLEAAKNVELIRDLAPQAKNLEGYLSPDTYSFARPTHPSEIVRTLVDRFRSVYGSLRATAAKRPRLTAYQLVTLASLVEKETGVPEERGLIAAVFYNRLQRGLPLQCDPTLIYAARLAADGYFDGTINISDLERASPYNTYLHPGLPPGPIANPGRASLEAVLNPPHSDFHYFVSNTRGGHFFARTSGEHERNVARYRRLRAQQEQKAAGAVNR